MTTAFMTAKRESSCYSP